MVLDTVWNGDDVNADHTWNATEGVIHHLESENYGFTYGPGYLTSVWSTNAYSSESSKKEKRPKLTIYYHLDDVSSKLHENAVLSSNEIQNVKLEKSKMTLSVNKNDLYNISVFNVSGKTLFDKKGIPLSVGSNVVSFDGDVITSGVYLAVIENSGTQFNRRVWIK